MFTPQLTRSRWAYIPEEYIKRLVQGRVRTIQKGKLEEDDTRCETMNTDKRESVKGKKKRNWTIRCRTVTTWLRLTLSDVFLEREGDEMGEARGSHVL